MCHLSRMSLLIYFSLLITQKNNKMWHKLGQMLNFSSRWWQRWSKRYAKIILIISCDNIFVCFTILNFAKEHCQNKQHKRLSCWCILFFFQRGSRSIFVALLRGSKRDVYLKRWKLRLYMKWLWCITHLADYFKMMKYLRQNTR